MNNFFKKSSLYKLAAGGKPSTRFPPGRLVELISMTKSTANLKRYKNFPIYFQSVYFQLVLLFVFCFNMFPIFWLLLFARDVTTTRLTKQQNESCKSASKNTPWIS